MGVLWGKIGEGVVQYWPLTNSFFLLGVLTSWQFWWKSIKKCDRESARRRTDTHWHTDRQMRTDFIICPMLYAIAMGQIKRIYAQWNGSSMTKPNPEDCSSKCSYDCTTSVHNTTQNSSDNLPSYLLAVTTEMWKTLLSPFITLTLSLTLKWHWYEIGCQLVLTLIGSHIRAFDWYRHRWLGMTLNGVIILILHYFTESHVMHDVHCATFYR